MLSMATNFSKELIIKPGHKVQLRKFDPSDTLSWKKGHAMEASLDKALKRLDKLQYLLYADHKRALLIVFQGLDAAGKDGTIRHVMSRVNPQGCRVTAFKPPSPEEAAHDFLWRVHQAVPPYGDIGIFNRSHYEDVLIVRVHNLVPKEVWSERYEQINRFEAILHENNVRILKFFLHISKDEQKKRFMERMDDPDKRWKISQADFDERKFWDEYTQAYEDALARCSTKRAPWFVIPADKKWFRNLAVSHIIVETLEEMHLKFPPPAIDVKKLKWR
jgi:PPK2 family polyphosphate:nucleotide phosphotransferase